MTRLSILTSGHPTKIITQIKIWQTAAICENFNLKQTKLTVNAMWDTGAEFSCISLDLAERLGLVKMAERQLGSVHAKSQQPVFVTDIVLTEEFLVPRLPITGLPTGSSFDVIIGMDIINRGNFHWDCEGSDSLLTFTVNE
jgi:hypothetical protein